MKILVLGDSHCDIGHIDFAYDKAERFDCDAVFVVGDFGWWPNLEGGIEFAQFCARLAAYTEIPLYFLDGNHEYHTDLALMVEDEGRDGFVELAPHFYYSPRGNTWTWDDVRFMTLGGAYSIDSGGRTLGVSWFEEELITEADTNYCIAQNEVDVLFCHDAPAEVDMNMQFAMHGKAMIHEMEGHTITNRDRLQRVVNSCNPRTIVHGHWHQQYTWMSDIVDGRKIMGLDCNFSQGKSWTILETEILKRH